MSSENALTVKGLSKAYAAAAQPERRLFDLLLKRAPSSAEQFWALRNVSFELARGETLGIVGRNGSGKSTLLQLLCGTLSPTQGTITTKGRVAALLELGSGFNPEFTGRENVHLNAAILGLSRAQTEARFDAIAQFADIGSFIEQPVKTYSSGMMLRLAFAVVAHVDADILIIDEALAVGDVFFTQKCMRFLRDFMKTRTVLFVSHDPTAVKSLCSRAIWLDQGEVRAIGSAKDVTDAYLKASFEDVQGQSAIAPTSPLEALAAPEAPQKDARQPFINASNLRNDIEIFQFDPDAASFGDRAVTVTTVVLRDGAGDALAWIVGGETIQLSIEVHAHHDVIRPIVGFFVRDRLGQFLFGDNTFLSHANEALTIGEGQHFVAEFTFDMPLLARGDYSICVAVASGTQSEHVQHQWIHDALLFKSQQSSVATGLVGIPMKRIALVVQSEPRSLPGKLP